MSSDGLAGLAVSQNLSSFCTVVFCVYHNGLHGPKPCSRAAQVTGSRYGEKRGPEVDPQFSLPQLVTLVQLPESGINAETWW